jgi:hypothetical protein
MAARQSHRLKLSKTFLNVRSVRLAKNVTTIFGRMGDGFAAMRALLVGCNSHVGSVGGCRLDCSLWFRLD